MTVDPFAMTDLAARTEFTRRGFVATSLGVGFTLAAGPVMAQTAIHTDSNGLVAGEVKIPASGGDMPAYRAMPASGGPFPTVLVVQEIFGVHEYIKDVCRRFGKLGYLAVAPELYARQADMSKVTDGQAAIAVMRRVPDAQVMGDLDSAAAWAKSSGKGDPGKLAVTGFCWGGRITWLYAEHNANLKAAVSWYGAVAGAKSEIAPTQPLDHAADLHCPVLGLYGGQDKGNPESVLDRMKQAAAAAGKTVQIVVYPEAQHGFHADYRASYDKPAAEDGWKRLQAWFRQNGVS